MTEGGVVVMREQTFKVREWLKYSSLNARSALSLFLVLVHCKAAESHSSCMCVCCMQLFPAAKQHFCSSIKINLSDCISVVYIALLPLPLSVSFFVSLCAALYCVPLCLEKRISFSF